MTAYYALKDAISIILYSRRQLLKWSFNSKITSNDNIKEQIKEQISALDFFFNIFIDNLHNDIKNIVGKKDLFIFEKLFNSVFTLNTLYDMRISELGKVDLLDLSNLNSNANDIIVNYSNIVTQINEPIIINNIYYSTYLHKLLVYVFFVWIRNFDLLISDIEVFNVIVQTYNVIVTKESKFTNINYQLATKIQDIDEQKIVINYLVKCEANYVILNC